MKQKSEESVLSRTIEIAQENTGPVALWCGLSVAVQLVLLAGNLWFLLAAILGQAFLGFYFYRALITASGHRADLAKLRSFLAVSVLTGLTVGFGTVLLIVPGMILYIRWIVAVPILFSEGTSSLDAISQSWERTHGRAGSIFVSLLPTVGLWIVSWIWFAVVDKENPASVITPAVIAGLAGALTFCCSVASYEISSPTNG